MALNRARVASDIAVDMLTGDYLVPVEFFDSAAPAVVIWPETFRVPAGATTQQLSTLVIARGQEIRGFIANQAAARQAAPAGTVVTVT